MSDSRLSSLLGFVTCTVAAFVLGCGTEPPRLASLEIISGNGQTGLVGGSLPVPLEVEAEDEDGSPIEGLALGFEVPAGGGQVRRAEDTTNREGRATAEFLLGNVPGPQAVTVSGGGGVIAVRFTATAAGVPMSVRIFAGNSQTRAGRACRRYASQDVVSTPAADPCSASRSASASPREAGRSSDPRHNRGRRRRHGGATASRRERSHTLDAVVAGATLVGSPVTFVATTTRPGGFDVVVRFTEPPTPAEALAFARARSGGRRSSRVTCGTAASTCPPVPAGAAPRR